MKHFFRFATPYFIIAFALFLSCNQDSAEKAGTTNDREIIPGKKVGAIHARTTEQDLIAIYGKENVLSDSISIGEGFFESGTILFKGKPDELGILWGDIEKKARPSLVQINHPKSKWKTPQGISIGTSLKELEKINGGSFSLYGFEWDYAGTVDSWNGGKLEDGFSFDHGLILRLEYRKKDERSIRAVMQVTGDRIYTSDLEPMQLLNPIVYRMEVVFR